MKFNFFSLNYIFFILFSPYVGYCSFEKMVTLTDSINNYSIGKSDYFFRDFSQQLKINDILSGKYDSLFKLSDKEVPNFGNQQATYWNKFTIYNAASNNTSWLLVIDEHLLDSIELYFPDSNKNYQSIWNGKSIPYDQRKYKYNDFVFDVPVKNGDTSVFYIKIRSHLIIYPLIVMKYEQFVESSLERNVAKGIIIGLFLMIILYNFFIYLSVNDKNYLYYTSYACINIIMICDLTGYMDSVWQGTLAFMWDKTPAIIAVDCIFLMLFTKNILEFNKYFPFANKVIYFILIPVTCWTITTNILGYKLYASITNQFFVLILVVFLYVAAITVYRKGYLPARFYIIACGAFFIACGTYAATLLGFIPVNNFTNHVIEIGSGIEMLLFSFALADKMRQFRKDKSNAQMQLVNTLKENELLILDQNKMLEHKVSERTKDLKLEKEKSETLLLNILPETYAEELKEKGFSEARMYENVSIMFIEFEDFTRIGESLSPKELVSEINHYFIAFDKIIGQYGLEKIKTFGGSYMVVSGLTKKEEDSSEKIVQASLEIIKFIKDYQDREGVFQVKIGIHNGSVVAGIVGFKKFAFDIWGDVVNTAARIQQTSLPGKINISGNIFHKIKESYECFYRGKIGAKHKGEIDMYFVEGIKPNLI